jgi:hypothetical protein
MINQLIKILTVVMLLASSSVLLAQNSSEKELNKTKAKAGCSKCIYHKSKKCALAVKIDDTVYQVEGSSLKDHGNSRKKNGLCRTEREVEVSGEIKDGKFYASHFALLPMQDFKLDLIEAEDT